MYLEQNLKHKVPKVIHGSMDDSGGHINIHSCLWYCIHEFSTWNISLFQPSTLGESRKTFLEELSEINIC